MGYIETSMLGSTCFIKHFFKEWGVDNLEDHGNGNVTRKKISMF